MKINKYEANPILKPNPANQWENLCVLNPGVIYDEENVENINEVGAICQEMTKFSSYDELTVNEEGISFYLNNLELKNAAELVEFAGLCQKLLKATNGECCGADELNLADLASDDGRIVNIKIDADNGYEIKIQTTDF